MSCRRGLLLLLCGTLLAQDSKGPSGGEDVARIAREIHRFFVDRGALQGGATPAQDARYASLHDVGIPRDPAARHLEAWLLEHRIGYPVPDLETIPPEFGTINALASFVYDRLPPHGRNIARGKRFLAVLLEDSEGRGAAVDRDGSFHGTVDGGRTWKPEAQGNRTLVAAHLVGGREAWAVDGKGELLRTSDGGRSWRRASYGPASGTYPSSKRHWLVPAPWYFACLAFVVFLLVQSLRREPPTEAAQGTVADVLVSDRPLRKGDPDHLGFSDVALGLSRFLRNEKTEPPLTIAITGEWGAGKSSLMNLVREDLEERGFRPVWFNAWHHQQEDHLLAALLQNIKERGVPPWASLAGLSFRLRLLRERIAHRWPISLGVLFLLSLSLAYLPTDGEDLDKVFERVNWGGATAIAGVLAALIPIIRSLTAFGMRPAQLMASLQDSFKPKDLEAQAGFRARFAREFEDVTEALHPRSLVILIDDLDRCQPDKVTEVLEAVNFLVSCGACFVIMGLAKERVEHCVGIAFKDLAEDGGEGNAQEWRRDFARKYLEKLINIEVPVPRPRVDEAEQLERMVAAAGTAAPDSRQKSRARLRKTVLDLALVTGLALAVALGVGLGTRWKEGGAGDGAKPSTGSASKEAPPGNDAGAGKEAAEAPKQIEPVGEVIAGEASTAARWPVYGMGLLIAVAALVLVAMRPSVTVPDSKEFRAALELWQPLIVCVHSTPRSVKRFLNRVRYLAMRQRRPVPGAAVPAGLWPRLLRLLGRPDEEAALRDGSIPEAALVGLCAIGHSRPEWLRSGAPAQKLAAFARERCAELRRPGRDQKLRERVARKWATLEAALKDLNLDSCLPDFLEATVEVEVY